MTTRQARCSCGHTVPSEPNLAFFEFRGEGSKRATETCGICRYDLVAHDPTTPHMARVERNGKTRFEMWMARVGQHEFTPLGPMDTDSYYCGCRGWD